MADYQFQKTLGSEVSISGIGLFTGEEVSVRLREAPVDSGIVFQRVDLPGKPLIPAQVQYVADTFRCTRLKNEEASIALVEHLLSALSALEIDNAHIEVTGPEIVSGDGSAQLFVELIERASIIKQGAMKQCATITHPVFWSQGGTHLIALPAPEFSVSYIFHDPRSSLLRSQYFSGTINSMMYKKEIAPCRTFALYEEVAPLIEKGLIKAGGLDNSVVIQGDKVLNPEGVRFSDEMVRHKILDLIGDLSLIGYRLKAHIVAIRSGHTSNVAFARMLQKNLLLDEQETPLRMYE